MKILYILSVYNIYGGTPKKTLDLIKFGQNDNFLYMYESGYNQFRYLFEEAGVDITEGYYGRNLFKHVKMLLKIIDENNIQIVQTQFTMGEVLGYMIKLLRPNVKLINAFVTPFEPKGIKKQITSFIYRQVDAFVFITEYVKKEKIKQYPILDLKYSKIIFNGTEERKQTEDNYPDFQYPALLDVAGLIDWKNIGILIDAMDILVNSKKQEVYLYIAGDGPERQTLEEKIEKARLEKYVILLGYQKNIGALLNNSDIYVHPAYAEGFGIAVSEAMMAEKPIIVSNAGALPELIINNESGLVVDSHKADQWANAILNLINNHQMSEKLANGAKSRAKEFFSIERYVKNYQDLYNSLLDQK